ncbi:MAG TPA: TonB-dependent receptor, partial [Steroidobacteraceae bacterium]|nr:TonB-dependent receptor [Steroidobacteraceae bacterium]
EVIPFWTDVVGSARRVVPLVYTDGTVALQPFGLRALGTQAWTGAGWDQMNFGVVIKSALGERWTLGAGVFHSRESDPQGHAPYLTLSDAHTADATMDIVPPFHAESTSGEVRLTRLFADGRHRRKLELAVRGRDVNRDFGGDSITDLGSQPLLSQVQIAPIAPVFSALGHDATKQLDVGLTYEERWQQLGSFAVGVLRDHYQRTVTEPGRTDAQRTTPALASLRLEFEGIHKLVLYSSYVQGLEDSALAPLSADNRNEPPPATRTWQLDGGLRWAPNGTVQVILGAFDIRKPYFNVGVDNVYRRLGRVEHHGLEGSMSYSDAGLTLLLGGVLLRSRVERVLPEPDATGSVPLGPVPLTLTANADYSPPRWRGWGASLQLNRLSRRVATADDAFYLPTFTTLGAGIRYQWQWSAHPWTVRLDGFNLTDAQGLNLSSLDVVLPDLGRRFALSLATDL